MGHNTTHGNELQNYKMKVKQFAPLKRFNWFLSENSCQFVAEHRYCCPLKKQFRMYKSDFKAFVRKHVKLKISKVFSIVMPN